MASYFDQFVVVSIIPGVTNSSMMLMIVIVSMSVLFKNNNLVPNRWQVIMEILYNHWVTLIKDSLGNKGLKYFPFVFSMFVLVAFLNLLGLFPYVFTVGTHIIITFGISLSILIAVTILGVKNFRLNFFSMLMPQGAPMVLGPLLVLIETASYLSRALSLGIRLAANLSAGHLLFIILASFSYRMLESNLIVLSLFPILIMIFITVLEIAVALIQAYVFCLLITIYLEDTLKLH